ncbi:uncharacterized protein LOC128549621 [Mercenaria mercenaria]|uniref:uncharacterized protein LOC128549621 n=1 Tax=Mercenaria mercenaria TaxID=6596 RepID=UPI00234F330F|nr:uncharacterized protein LOC128549621 [Mercenaria mercenaria]
MSLVYRIGFTLESLFDYVRSNKEWTWGGAAGAVIEGGLNGAVQKWVPKWAQPLVGGGIHVLGSWAQHAIDGEPYSFKDAFTDFSSYVVNENSLVKKVKSIDKTIDKVCSLLEKYIDFIQKTCDVKRQLDREVRKIADGVTQWVRSMDPNDISGPTGYGRARFIQKDHRMEYKIRFENNENATAPAQRVYIEHKYSEHLDARTFIMGDFGFGNFTKEFPPKSKLFQGTIDMTAELGIVIRVFAGLDLEKNMVIWEFQSLDPKTGDAPTDPSIGFLPPNNGTSGQGYVTFSMKPNKDVAHLSTVHANASIYFDQNEPIDTPNIFNTVNTYIFCFSNPL